MYIYISDLECFNKLYCVDNACVRIEQYNDKKIGIIHFGGDNEQPREDLKVEEDKIITFNLWQIVKHMALEERDNLVNELFGENALTQFAIHEKNEMYMMLHYIYFGIDYSCYNDGILIGYAIDERAKKYLRELSLCEDIDEICQRFIDKELRQLLNPNQHGMFRQYCANVIYSFLYGNARTVDDMLFLHLFAEGNLDVTDIEIDRDKNMERGILDICTENKKVSKRRIYEYVITYLDKPIPSYADKRKVESVLEENDVEKDIVYKKIMDACDNIEYTWSDLYLNLIELM